MKCFLKIYKISLFLLVLLFLVCGFSSCTWFGLDKRSNVERTVLVYIAANNDLSRYAASNLEELKQGYVPDYFKPGSPGEVILVYYHIAGELARLLRVSTDEHGKVNQEIIKEYDENQNSADASTLKEVLEYTANLFPSEENGLFLWSHGTGWLPEDFYSNPFRSSIGKDGQLRRMNLPVVDDPMRHLVKSFGVDDGKEIEIQDLADALPIKYSFIVFDACLMGGIEVAYELKDKADYVLSSSAEVLAQGFPYDKIMTHLFEDEELGSNLIKVCDEYVDFYSSMSSQTSRSATVSLVKTSKLRELAATSAVIFNDHRDNVETLNVNKIQRYFRHNKHWFYDLDDYMKNISGNTSDYQKFSSAMKNAVVYKKSTPYFFFDGNYFVGDGFAVEHFSGLSTYIPKPSDVYLEKYYRDLSWNKDTQMIK